MLLDLAVMKKFHRHVSVSSLLLFRFCLGLPVLNSATATVLKYPPPHNCSPTYMKEVNTAHAECIQNGIVDSRLFRHHAYYCESGETPAQRVQRMGAAESEKNCEKYDVGSSWIPGHHYPWSDAVVRRNGYGDSHHPRHEVIYGTEWAQSYIFEHQNPEDCYAAKYIEYTFGGWPGMGSHIHIGGQALALAIQLGRVLVWNSDDPYFAFKCGERQNSWDCWFLPISKCKLDEMDRSKLDIIEKENVNGLAVRSHPCVFQYQFCSIKYVCVVSCANLQIMISRFRAGKFIDSRSS